MTRLFVVCVLLAAVLTGSALAASPPGGGVHCGTERWSVKTLSDPLASSVNLTPIVSDVQHLGRIPRPANIGTDRTAPETRTYTIRAILTGVRSENDHDYHMILHGRVTPTTMIAESPAPDCSGARDSAEFAQMAAAHSAVPSLTIGSVVTVTGVAFFDFDHGQTGRAPNVIELHPVLAIKEG